MVKLVDTHAHIYAVEFDSDRAEMLQNAQNAGVVKILMPNIDLHSITGMLQLADSYPDFCIPMMGLHPCSVNENWESTLEEIFNWFKIRKFIAVGEIGIDLYWDKTTLEIQQKAFKKQVEFTIENNLPIAIHSRSATPEIVEILRQFKGENIRGVFHCFSEYYEFIHEIADMGFYFGIGGVISFKNSGLFNEIKNLPMDRIVLETDAPYLAPIPFRGKRNEPAFVWHVASKLAEATGLSLNEIGELSSKNAKELFRF